MYQNEKIYVKFMTFKKVNEQNECYTTSGFIVNINNDNQTALILCKDNKFRLQPINNLEAISTSDYRQSIN